MEERYCLRVEGLGVTIQSSTADYCAECGERPVYNRGYEPPFPAVRLVCPVCLMALVMTP